VHSFPCVSTLPSSVEIEVKVEIEVDPHMNRLRNMCHPARPNILQSPPQSMFSVFMVVRHQELPWCEAINIVWGPYQRMTDGSYVPSFVVIEGMVEYFDLRPSLVRVGVGIRVVVGIRKMINSVYIDRILILRVGYEVDPVCDEGSFESI
jgi:phage shock protein PspC (stress-responsive transcriptional regulator)